MYLKNIVIVVAYNLYSCRDAQIMQQKQKGNGDGDDGNADGAQAGTSN